MNALELTDVVKRYGSGARPAVDHVSLAVRKGEILSLVGPSGCGKTSTLRLIAGFERPEAGAITLYGRVVANHTAWVPAEQRGVGMVFQDYALFPHLSVRGNVAYGLAGQPRERIAESVASVLEMVGLTPLADRYPHELSGGERQRAALARALAPSPVLLLLDEPFSSLDVDRRVTVREQVRAILRSQSATAIFVTHDHEEALFMGDRVAVINQGRLEQVGAPEQIFHAPVTRFVAEFMGRTDFLPGEVTAEGVLTEIGLLAQRMAAPLGTAVEVAIRADDVTFERDPASRALVLARHFKGAQNVYRLRLPSGRLLHSLQPHTFILPPGTPVHVRPNASHPLACYHAGQWVPPAE